MSCIVIIPPLQVKDLFVKVVFMEVVQIVATIKVLCVMGCVNVHNLIMGLLVTQSVLLADVPIVLLIIILLVKLRVVMLVMVQHLQQIANVYRLILGLVQQLSIQVLSA